MSINNSVNVSNHQLTKNVVWNFIGLAVPLLIGIISIPILIEGLGKERFGLLTIIWMGVGYFSLFDMGLGRALTKLVSERLGKNEYSDLGSLIWSALWMILALGTFATFLVLSGASYIVGHILNIPVELKQEAIIAFYILGIGLPFVTLTTALQGLLESHQKFALITSIRIPLGAVTFIGPLITLYFTPSLIAATATMLLGRIIATLVYSIVASFFQKELRKPVLPKITEAKHLFKFGGWLTVSNIIGPVMVYFDRFLIGSLQNMTAVAYYVTPYEVLSRLQLLPVAVMGVIFPAMSAAQNNDGKRMQALYVNSANTLVVLMIPPVTFLFLFAPELLFVWLGPEFSKKSTVVVYWLALGWLINVMAHTPFTALQSVGRPDLVAKIHIAELIPYLIALWYLTHEFGIAGTAAAWFGRVLIDAIIFNVVAGHIIQEIKSEVVFTFIRLLVILIVSLFLYVFIQVFILKLTAFLIIMLLMYQPMKKIYNSWIQLSSATH